MVKWKEVTAKDSSGRVYISVEPAKFSPQYKFWEGTKTVSYTATDSSNNKAYCSVRVTVHGN